MKGEEVIPSAARLTNSLRDLGYEFVNAVADLVDNSIAANAGRIDISISFDGPDSWVRIADNGTGMAGVNISEAMRLGTTRDYTKTDLGKFGLGLKTASLSQCRLLNVASRTNGERRQIEARCLDLDHVTRTDRWEIMHLAATDRPEELVNPLRETTGTVVLWQNLDRVLEFRDPWGGWAERHLLHLAEKLELHLAMVFARFISGEARRQKLVITLNGNEVEPWDPFVRNEPKVEDLPVHEFRVAGGLVRYQPFVLPAQRDFTDDAAWRQASGPSHWNRQQGFYIYRADRMIQSGGWSHLRSPDEHTKLARAAIEFWPDLDEAFEINISKMRVRLPEEFREQLKPKMTALIRRAEEKYRQAGRTPTRPPAPPRPHAGTPAMPPLPGAGQPQPPPGQHSEQISNPDAGGAAVRSGTWAVSGGTSRPKRPGLAQLPTRSVSREQAPKLATALQTAADRVGQGPALAAIRAEVRRADPEVARELGW